MRLLIDGDEANNNGNWQWIAPSASTRSRPSRRILQPVTAAEHFDPDGGTSAATSPSSRDVPHEYLSPSRGRMPGRVQRGGGCVIGPDYPEPIVDHAQARREALDRYAAAR